MTKDGRTATAIVAAHPMGRELWVLVDGGRWASQVHSSDEKADADAAERYTRGIASGWLDSPGMTTARARRSGLNARSSWPGAEGRLEFCLRAGEQNEPNASTSGAFVAATWRAVTLDEFRPAAAVGGSCGVCRERIVVRWHAMTQCLFDGALGDRVGAGKVGDCACALQNAIAMCWIIRPSRQSRVEQLDGGVRHSQRMILGSQCATSAGFLDSAKSFAPGLVWSYVADHVSRWGEMRYEIEEAHIAAGGSACDGERSAVCSHRESLDGPANRTGNVSSSRRPARRRAW
jgi:hypothetical protein